MKGMREVGFVAALILAQLLSGGSAMAHERRTAIVEAVEKAGPAVVNIRTEQVVNRRSSPFFGFGDRFFDEFFRDLGPSRVYRTQSLGSGVIIDPRGYILTNAHVIEKASKVYVALPGRSKEVEATLVGVDERVDLAVIRVEGERALPHLSPGRSDDLLLGETVIAIGNPLGLGHSITTGVISTGSRRLPTGEGNLAVFIQTDALINPGNSGGPLININGELIGINTAIATQAQGIGFSIPIGVAKRVLADLIEFGRVRRAFLGIIPGQVGKAFARSRGAGGVLVTEVEPDSPAGEAKLQIADVILELDGVAVESPREFLSLLGTYTPGDPVRLGLLRGTEERTLQLRLTEVPAGYGFRYGEKVFGFAVREEAGGVTVASVAGGSSAERVGMRRGDRVAEVGGRPVASLEEYGRQMEFLLGQLPVNFLIVRGNRGYSIDLP